MKKNNQNEKSSAETKPDTDPVVFQLHKPSKCGSCSKDLGKGNMVKLVGEGEDRIALCKPCAGLRDLFIVPAGNAQLTRKISSYAKQKHVILRWSNTRKRYERQGLLVELEALNRAEQELGLELTPDCEYEA